MSRVPRVLLAVPLCLLLAGCPPEGAAPRGPAPAAKGVTARGPGAPAQKPPPAADPTVAVAPRGGAALPSAAAAAPHSARSFRIPTDLSPKGAAPSVVAAPPLSLTATDGTGLRLAALRVQAVVEEPLAFTELHLTFDNPEPRTIEGRFRIALPPGAAVSRFAMRIGDRWQEGEVVERQAARRAYEDFLHRKQDPALLEQQAGNEFTARVFPIPAQGRKELILSYSQELVAADQPYSIPLHGLPELGELDIRVLLGKTAAQGSSSLGGATLMHQTIEVRKQGWVPDRDFTVAQVNEPQRLGLRHDNLVVARVSPVIDPLPDEVSSLLILVDSSASRALGYAAQVALVGRLVQGLAAGAGAQTPVAVACFDQQVELLYAGPAGGFGAEQLARLRERQALGATDLRGALEWTARYLGGAPQRLSRALLVTDGVATAGETEGDALRQAVVALRGLEVERLDAVVLGGIRDQEALRGLVTAGLVRDGAVIDGDAGLAAVTRRLTAKTRSGIQVEVAGARWVWPTRLDGVQAGDDVLIYADLPAEQRFALSLGGVAMEADRLKLVTVERPLLERGWVQARMRRLQQQRDTLAAGDADLRSALAKQITELSVRHRVLSRYTALLVLETERDYARFGIDRRALADILSVGPGGLTVLRRGPDSLPPRPTVVKPPPPMKRTADKQKRGGRSRRLSMSMEGEGEGEGGLDDSLAAKDDEADEDRKATLAMEDAPSPEPSVVEAPKAEEAEEASAAGDGVQGATGVGGLGLRGTGSAGGGLAGAEGSVGSRGPERAARPRPSARPAPGRANEPGAATVRVERPTVVGSLPRELVERIARRHVAALKACYLQQLQLRPGLGGRLELDLVVGPSGAVQAATVATDSVGSAPLTACVLQRVRRWTFPGGAGIVRIRLPLRFEATAGGGGEEEQRPAASPYEGRTQDIMAWIKAGQKGRALEAALSWRRESPGDVMALVALGEALEANGETLQAARAYGSLIDLFPSRADLRRFAGQRLERLPKGAGLAMAADTFRQAVAQRPDHPASHRLLAFALLRLQRPAEAFAALQAGLRRTYPPGRFAGAQRILREDLGLLAAAWTRAEPARRDEILESLRAAGGTVEDAASLRFVLNWETDANDVDFHIYDGRGAHAYYQQRSLSSGGELYADVTTGYGPECFTIRKPAKQRAYPYTLRAHYYSRGPMGYGMGKLEVIEHDGAGTLRFRELPFVVMKDQAYVDLARVTGPLTR